MSVVSVLALLIWVVVLARAGWLVVHPPKRSVTRSVTRPLEHWATS